MLYRVMRNLHLYAGLALLLLVLMYFFTGLMQIHRSWFGQGEAVASTQTQTLEPWLLPAEEGSLAEFLKQELRLQGRSGRPQVLQDGTREFRYFRPGQSQRVLLSADRVTATITTTREPWQQTFIALHRLHGYGGGWFHNLWAAFLDVTSTAMIVFGVTGIYLWWRLARRHWPGLLVLGSTYALAAATVLYLMLA